MSSPAAVNPCLVRVGFRKNLLRSSPRIPAFHVVSLEKHGYEIRRTGCRSRHASLCISALDDGGPADYFSFDGFEGTDLISDEGMLSISDGEESDGELFVISSMDADLPRRHDLFDKSNAVAVATHRFSTLRRRCRRGRIQPGVFINMGLIAFITVVLLLFDWCSWKIVRLPLPSFFLMRPFAVSVILASFAGFLYVPIVDRLKIHQIIRKEGPLGHALKKGTPTMGGLFFIPIGVTVALAITGFSSIDVYGAATATIAYAAIGLLDDILSSVNNHNYGLSSLLKFCLLATVGTWFSVWLDSADISSPYSMYSFS